MVGMGGRMPTPCLSKEKNFSRKDSLHDSCHRQLSQLLPWCPPNIPSSLAAQPSYGPCLNLSSSSSTFSRIDQKPSGSGEGKVHHSKMTYPVFIFSLVVISHYLCFSWGNIIFVDREGLPTSDTKLGPVLGFGRFSY